ncbi:sodium/potassium-transporting ATPase subunit beta-1-like [Anastrepha ludens]|uniref:sodium/potassium-transporting ATPase subunit beta-1-like n=1 Tax=Anastrepha ludens TaxID=28586 RepID=UPI0023B0498C|nr:sodium/potassium-transporting ATPase subunit beta-1-like [Anastrepha ludens]
MYEAAGNYVLEKRFRHKNYDEDSAAFQSTPLGASTSQAANKESVPETSASNFLLKSVQKVYQLPKKRRSRSKETIPSKFALPGQTKGSKLYWLKTLVYYALFLAGIAALFSGCFLAYMSTLPEEVPRVSKYQPALIYYPNLESYYINRIIWNEQNEEDINRIVKQINRFLKKSRMHGKFGECTEFDSYGYKDQSPCIFLKVNRIAGFRVDPIEDSKDVPWREHALKKHIESLPSHERKGRLWITCRSDAWVDMKYFPSSRSIPVERLNSKGLKNLNYQRNTNYTDERIVAIKLRGIPLNVPFNVRCKMFAKNIEVDYYRNLDIGGVNFDIHAIV